MTDQQENEMRYLSIETLQLNFKQIDLVRTISCLAGGIITGLCNLTGFYGVLSFFIFYLTINCSILIVTMKVDTKLYTNLPFWSFVFHDFSKHAMSFLLFWTLSYALAYLY